MNELTRNRDVLVKITFSTVQQLVGTEGGSQTVYTLILIHNNYVTLINSEPVEFVQSVRDNEKE